MGIEFLDYQKYVFMNSWITPYVVWCMSRASGKALDLDTRMPTPDGDKTMRDIHVGDYVFDEKGNPTLVTYESPIYYNHDCYKVTFEDGEEIIADADHNWYVHYKCRTADENGCKVFTTAQMYENYIHEYKSGKKAGIIEYRYRIDRPLPLQYTKKDLPIHPYIFGIWLGGYSIYSLNNDRDTQKRIRIRLPDGTPLKVALRNLGVLDNKHIPYDYLYSDVQDRLWLL